MGHLIFKLADRVVRGIPVPSCKTQQINAKEVKTNYVVFIRDQHSVIGCSV